MRALRLFITVIILLALVPIGAAAQHIQLRASVDRNNMLIGEPILLTLEGEFPRDAPHNWFNTDSLAHFEEIERAEIDTALQGNDQFLKLVLRITSFDSGSWVIPMMSLRVGNNNYLTDSIVIEVGYTPADPNKPYHDIRDIIEVQAPENDYTTYIAIAASVLLLLLLLYLLFRKKKKAPASQPAQTRLTAIEKARTELKALQAEDPATTGRVKYYYSRLNDILRDYLLAKKIITSPDGSNRDVFMSVQSKLGHEEKQALAKALTLADAAKFAKYQPTATDHADVFQTIQSSIEKIEQLDNKVLS